MRFKNRYLVFELVWKDRNFDPSITEALLLAAFRDSLQQNFGDHGLGCALASLQVKYYNPVSSLCVVRCSRDEYREIWASISLITTINHRVLMPRLVQLTGSLPRCQAAALQAHAGATAGARLSPQQAKLAEEANTRLLAMAV